MTLNIYIGWTGENALAYEVCRASLLAKATIPVNVIPLRHWELRHQRRYWRPYKVTGAGQRIDGIDNKAFSTDFSFTRFLVPELEGFENRFALYCDSDMLWLDDVGVLMGVYKDSRESVLCVQHRLPLSVERVKITGSVQSHYKRKNWSSLMLMNSKRCKILSTDFVSEASGAELHGFHWLDDENIGALHPRWNVLHGLENNDSPAVIHFTLGTPNMPFKAKDDEWSVLWRQCADALEKDGVERVRNILS